MIVLSKTDLTTEQEAAEVEAIIRKLNPGAKTIEQSKVTSRWRLYSGHGYDYDEAASSAGWIKELQGEHMPETEEYGISSFVYRTSHLFDAEKLWNFFNSEETSKVFYGQRDFSGLLLTTVLPTNVHRQAV